MSKSALALIPGPVRDRSLSEPTPEQRAGKLAQEIRELAKITAEAILLIGEKLCQVKQILPHGAWLPWIEKEFSWSECTAQRFMQVHERFHGKSRNLRDLSIDPSAFYSLARPSTPDPVVNEILGRAEAGEHITLGAVREVLTHQQDRGGDYQAHLNWLHQHPADIRRGPDVTLGEVLSAVSGGPQAIVTPEEKAIEDNFNHNIGCIRAAASELEDFDGKPARLAVVMAKRGYYGDVVASLQRMLPKIGVFRELYDECRALGIEPEEE